MLRGENPRAFFLFVFQTDLRAPLIPGRVSFDIIQPGKLTFVYISRAFLSDTKGVPLWSETTQTTRLTPPLFYGLS